MASLKKLDTNRIAHLIAPLHAASWQASYRGIFKDDYLNHEVGAERLRHWQAWVPRLVDCMGEIFLASIAGVPVGFLCIEIGPERALGAYVDNLHVLPAGRGQGVGKLLVAAAQAWALKQGEAQLYLRVYEDNLQARAFYAHEGWHAVAREMDDLPGGGQAAVLKLIKVPPRA